jgi:prephenate dehydratase
LSKQTGYLGPPGTFGEQAALHYDRESDLVPLPTHTAVVEAVLQGSVDQGIAAVENSLEGAVNETLDALLRMEGVFVKGELVLPIEYNLIAASGTRLEDVTVVMSHPVALPQCRDFLEKALPWARVEAALSTAAAVETAVKTPGAAALGTRRAAELSGGAILAEGIQDVATNKTRFLVLAREDAPPTGDDKTSIAFTVPHDRPGSLLSVLEELARRKINMTRIESRPSREDLGIYVFLVDFQGHRRDGLVAEALEAVRVKSQTLRLFGSYPRFGSATPA